MARRAAACWSRRQRGSGYPFTRSASARESTICGHSMRGRRRARLQGLGDNMGMKEKPRRPHRFEGFLLDFGPLLLFFVAYKMTGIIVATLVFIVAILVAILVSLIRFRWVPPMTWISAILIVGF